MGLAGFEPATTGLAVDLTKNPSPKPGTLYVFLLEIRKNPD